MAAFNQSQRWFFLYLYPLFVVVVQAAVEVGRQLGGVDDLRQAL